MQRERLAPRVLDRSRFCERQQRGAVSDLVLDQDALPGCVFRAGVAFLIRDVDHEAGQAVVEDARFQAGLEISLDDVVEHAVELLQCPGFRPLGERGDDQSEHHADGERHPVEPQGMDPPGAERKQFLIGRQPSDAELDPEHERKRGGNHQEVGRKRRGHPDEIAHRHGVGEQHLVELQELQHEKQLHDRQKTDAEGDGDLPEHESIQQRHRRTL